MIYEFEDFQLDTSLYELRKAGEVVRMEPQVFNVLAFLVEHGDRVVTKDELLEHVWGDKYISEAALNSRLMAARRAIGDSGTAQRLIKTLHGRGFRFIGSLGAPQVPVQGESPAEPGQQPGEQGSAERQTIKFCRTPDGVNIAYASVGRGNLLIKAPNWLTHLEYEWLNPVWRHWWQELARDHEVIRFDQRGSGLSDRDAEDLSFDAWVRDLEAVVDACGARQFALLGISQGGAAAIEYACRHPERLTHLVLVGTYTRGWKHRGRPLDEQQAVMTLIREGWGRDNPVYRQLFSMTFMPDGTPEQIRYFNELQRVSTTAKNAIRLREAAGDINVAGHLPQIKTPTLVLHARGDERVPFDEGRLLASSIPNARFVPLNSRNHLTLEDEPAWHTLISEVRAFLNEKH